MMRNKKIKNRFLRHSDFSARICLILPWRLRDPLLSYSHQKGL